jgi:hypothetical protein
LPPPNQTELVARVQRALGRRVVIEERIQELWDGYGELWRAVLEGSSDALAEQTGVVLKSVAPPAEDRLRVGRQTLGSHRRKLRSYDVELAFYRDFAARCGADCRVPAPQLLERSARGWLFVLEDLDRAGFAGRRSLVDSSEV